MGKKLNQIHFFLQVMMKKGAVNLETGLNLFHLFVLNGISQNNCFNLFKNMSKLVRVVDNVETT